MDFNFDIFESGSEEPDASEEEREARNSQSAITVDAQTRKSSDEPIKKFRIRGEDGDTQDMPEGAPVKRGVYSSWEEAQAKVRLQARLRLRESMDILVARNTEKPAHGRFRRLHLKKGCSLVDCLDVIRLDLGLNPKVKFLFMRADGSWRRVRGVNELMPDCKIIASCGEGVLIKRKVDIKKPWSSQHLRLKFYGKKKQKLGRTRDRFAPEPALCECMGVEDPMEYKRLPGADAHKMFLTTEDSTVERPPPLDLSSLPNVSRMREIKDEQTEIKTERNRVDSMRSSLTKEQHKLIFTGTGYYKYMPALTDRPYLSVKDIPLREDLRRQLVKLTGDSVEADDPFKYKDKGVAHNLKFAVGDRTKYQPPTILDKVKQRYREDIRSKTNGFPLLEKGFPYANTTTGDGYIIPQNIRAKEPAKKRRGRQAPFADLQWPDKQLYKGEKSAKEKEAMYLTGPLSRRLRLS